MRKIKIVADSSCDLFTLGEVAFASAPMKICTAEREFVDDGSLDVCGMVEYLYRYKGKSRSFCPNTSDWLEAFGDADEIFCVTITGGLSGSYNSACAAKALYESENTGRRVCVFDTLSAGPEVALTAEKIKACIGQGMSFEEISEAVTAYMKKTGLVFMLKSLKNFANNGRVSPLVAKLVGIAGIGIVGKASEKGTLEPMHKCCGERRSLDTLVADLEAEGFRSGRVKIGHCMNAPFAERLRERLLAGHPTAQIEIYRLAGLCSFYAEKGGVLVGFEKA